MKKLNESIRACDKEYLSSMKAAWITEFVSLILHGSDDHRSWLKKAGDNYIKGYGVNFENEYKK